MQWVVSLRVVTPHSVLQCGGCWLCSSCACLLVVRCASGPTTPALSFGLGMRSVTHKGGSVVFLSCLVLGLFDFLIFFFAVVVVFFFGF